VPQAAVVLNLALTLGGGRWTGEGKLFFFQWLLVSLLLLLPGVSDAEIIPQHLIVQYVERPAVMAVVNDSLDTEQPESDGLINRRPVEVAVFLWQEESPQQTFLSNCLLVVYQDSLRLTELDSLRQSLGTRGEIEATFLDSSNTLDSDLIEVHDTHGDLQWDLHDDSGEAHDIDWLRAWSLGDPDFSAQAVVAVLDNSSVFKSSFDAPPAEMDLMHPDFDWEFCWLNGQEDLAAVGIPGEFDEEDIDLYDDDGNGFLDDVIGWDFSHCYSLWQESVVGLPLDCDLVEGMLCWAGSGPYQVNGDPFPHVLADHGAKVVGVIAAITDNNRGIAGITNIGLGTSGIRVMHLKTGRIWGTAAQSARALEYARRMGAEVVNMSWGSDDAAELLSPILDMCYEDGIVLVASAGNWSPEAGLHAHFPSTHDKVISVAASTSVDLWRDDSCYIVEGEESGVDIAAPGQSIPTLTLGLSGAENEDCQYAEDYDLSFNYTSAAAPHVASAAALLIAHAPDHFRRNPDAVRYRLTRSAQKIDGAQEYPYIDGVSARLGWGRVNLFYAANYIEGAQSSVTRIQPSLESHPTVVTCPGDTLDNMIFRLTLKDEFGELVSTDPDVLGKALEFSAQVPGPPPVSVDLIQDAEFIAYINDLGIGVYVPFAKVVASGDAYVDVHLVNPEGWGKIDVKGHVIDSAAKRVKWLDPLHMNFLAGSFMHAELGNPLPVTFTTVDFDADGDVDLRDWKIFAEMLGSTTEDEEYCICGDYDADGDIDIADSELFSTHFGH